MADILNPPIDIDNDLPEYEFHRKARQPGGVERDRAIAKAHSELKRLEPALVDFVERECEALAVALSDSQMVGANQAGAVAKAHACSERLRDVAGAANQLLIGYIAKNLCEIFEVLETSPIHYPYAVIACHYDALLLAQQDRYRDKTPQDLLQLSDGLRDAVQVVKDMGLRLSASETGPKH